MLAAAIIVATTVPNLLGHRQSAWAQNVTTIVKLALFVAMVAAGFAFGGGSFERIAAGRPLREVDLGTAATQLFYVMFAYSGWNAASYLAGEVKSPATTLPRSLLLGTGAVTVLYLAMNLLFAWAVPLAEVNFGNAEQVPRIAVERLFGPRVAGAFSAAVGLTFLATVNAFIVTGPRVYFAMARDGLFPSIAGRLSRRGQVPVNATLAQSGCAVVILLATDFQEPLPVRRGRPVAVCVAVHRRGLRPALRRPEMPRPFRVPGYPVVPAFFMLATCSRPCSHSSNGRPPRSGAWAASSPVSRSTTSGGSSLPLHKGEPEGVAVI